MLYLARRVLSVASFIFVFAAPPALAEGPKDWLALSEKAYAAVQSDPTNAKRWNTYGFYAYRAGSTVEALQALKKSLALAPDFAVAWNNLGVVQLQNKAYDAAIKAFETALEHNANYSKARYNLAVAKFRNGEYKDALVMYWDLRNSDAAYVEQRTDLTKAEKALDEALAKNPDDGFLKSVKKKYRDYKERDRESWGW